MASYGLLLAVTGFSYSAVTGTLILKPKLGHLSFVTFFSTASGWGTITIQERTLKIHIKEGNLRLNTIKLELLGNVYTLAPNTYLDAGIPFEYRF